MENNQVKKDPALTASLESIKEFSGRIAECFSPEKIVLFGSWARGMAGADSDVDLLVIMPFDGKGWEQASRIRARLRAPFPLDLIVRSPGELSERLAVNDVFFSDILRTGKTLHEKPHGRVGRQS
jgi:predicted nucleotidyltransferase